MKVKKVSNYELFFDLVFVLATSQLVGILHSTPEHIVNLQGILAFCCNYFNLECVVNGELILKSLQ